MLTVSVLSLTGLVLCSKLLFKTTRFQTVNNKASYRKWLILPAIVTLWYLFSFIYSEDLITAVKTTKVKALFILLPFILLSINTISKRQISYLYHCFLVLILVGSCWSLLQIPIQQIDLAENYSRGWVIPTVIHHIRFSLFVAFGAIICWFMIFRQPIERLLPRYGYLILAIFFF